MASINKQKNGKWRVRIRQKNKTTLTKTFTFKTDAEIWARDVEASLDKSQAIVQKLKNKTLLSEVIERYRVEVAIHKKGYARENNRLLNWRNSELGKKRIYDVTASDVAFFRDGLAGTGKSASTIKNELAPLSSVFSMAISEWGFDNLINPVKIVKKPKKDPPRDIRLTPNERELIFQIPAIDVRLAAIFAVETSARLLEIVSLEKTNVNEIMRTAILHDKVGQNKGVVKRVPLSTRAMTAIHEAMQQWPDSKYVFCGSNPQKQSARISDLWRANKQTWGFREEVWFKDLRHEAISTFFEKGLSITEVMSITGHTNPAQLSTYVLHLHQKNMASRLD